MNAFKYLFLSAAAGFALVSQAPVVGAPAQSMGVQTDEIVMYVLPQCGYCERARGYLQARGLSWREVDIAASPEAKAEFDARGGAGTPLIFIGADKVSGFDTHRLDALLAQRSEQ